MNSKSVLILGAGVSGLTTALKLLQSGYGVTVCSREPEGTLPSTSLNAYAMWVPVRLDADHRVERWANESLSEFVNIARDPDSGVILRPVFVLKTRQEEPWYAASVPGFRHARRGEISGQYQDAHVLDAAPVIEPSRYLLWLRSSVVALGGRFLKREVDDLGACPGEQSIIVNCTGLGARRLARDPQLRPERVQVVTIRTNGFDRVVIDDEGPNKRACIVPHRDYIKVGAVFDGERETLEVDELATRDILQRCCRMVPGFKADVSDVLSVNRALRPERHAIRVEIERMADGRAIIHNYGHDGMGYIVSHGIAREITGYVASL
jgi:D-amino-acid oxidase